MEQDYIYNQSDSQSQPPYPYEQPPVFYPPYQMPMSAPVYYGTVAGGDLAYAGPTSGQSADYHMAVEHVTAAPSQQHRHGNQTSRYYGNSSFNSTSVPFNSVQFFQDAAMLQNNHGYHNLGQQPWSCSFSETDCNSFHGNTQNEGLYSGQQQFSSTFGNDIVPGSVAQSNPGCINSSEQETVGRRESGSARGRGQRNRGGRNKGVAKPGQTNTGWGRKESRVDPRKEMPQSSSRQRHCDVNECYDDGWTGQKDQYLRNRSDYRRPTRGMFNDQFYTSSQFDDSGTSRNGRANRRGGYSPRQLVPNRGRQSGTRNDRRGRGGWTIGGNSKGMQGSNASQASDAESASFKGRGARRGAYIERGGGRRRHTPCVEELDVESQRGLLIEQLSAATYECMVCCEVVRCDSAIWSCDKCYHIFHLHCIKRWARSPTAAEVDGSGWRCPACQNVTQKVPYHYRCFCDKLREPEWQGSETPHSCGEVCGKQRSADCPHPCNLLCHPGPCPPCQATVTKSCSCGKTKQKVKCGQGGDVRCEQTCEKTLNCGKHSCTLVCHSGSCQPCHVTIEQDCFCGQTQRTVMCGTAESFLTAFSCDKPCNRLLSCDNHHCDQCCHPGACTTCTLLPSVVTHCPCGKTPLSELTATGQERMSCTDAIPTCTLTCDKELTCGPPDARHQCQQACHQGECGVCKGVTEVTCRCGSVTKEMPCEVALTYTGEEPFKCDRRCSKKKHCGRHRCSQLCCVDTTHRCDQICGGKLTCGLHRCEESCHRGNCPTCWQVSFDELRCHCGVEVIYPPIPCGTPPPECRRPCTRVHPCGHRVIHLCHSEENCPLCTQLTEKWCMGGHEKRKSIPCHLTNISCGLPCGRQLPCGQHKCQRSCHKGECLTDGQTCKQPCVTPRECGHPCNEPCHAGHACPKSSCKSEVALTCVCGFRTEKVMCWQQSGKDGYQKLATSMLALQMKDSQSGDTIDISSLTQETTRTKHLECNQACAQHERNQRVALALEIKNPDLSSKLGHPPYPQFIKDFAKQHPDFVNAVEKALSVLVNTAQQSKQPKRSHSFAPMSFEQRRVVHTLAEFYGCETQSYDHEPKKNIVATAYKNKCWHPTVTVSALVGNSSMAPIPFRHTSLLKLRSMSASTGNSGSPNVPEPTASESGSASWASALKANTSTHKPQQETTTDYFEMTD